MTRGQSRGARSSAWLAIALGAIGGLVLILLSQSPFGFFGPRADRSGRVAILVNGLDSRVSRDLLLPAHGWVLSVELPEHTPDELQQRLSVNLRAERTGATIQIEDRFESRDGGATLVIPESLGLFDGLLSIRAVWTDADGNRFEDWRRVRVRPWLGGPPIGDRQIVHFDFESDRDDDGRPDFHQDLEAFGLASADHPELARIVADRIADRALARVRAAYDDRTDPNWTGLAQDPVRVTFRLEADPGPYVTRICVGGDDPTKSDSVGHVRFDRANDDRSSIECSDDPVAGIFPGAFSVYRDDALFRERFGPFLPTHQGVPIGMDPQDGDWLANPSPSPSPGDPMDGANPVAPDRGNQIEAAIAVFGDALGSIMAHEAGHSLGLVAEGKPAVGLFGGSQGEAYAHNLAVDGEQPAQAWLMNAGRSLPFEALAGQGQGGVLRFRPLNYAYLRDRVVLADPKARRIDWGQI
jgi:hypothetical protein